MAEVRRLRGESRPVGVQKSLKECANKTVIDLLLLSLQPVLHGFETLLGERQFFANKERGKLMVDRSDGICKPTFGLRIITKTA